MSKMKKLFFIWILLLVWFVGIGAEKYKYVVLETNQGVIKLKLYEDTPLHSGNFIKLVKEKHYDGLLFHRVIDGFMIQGGSSDSRNAEQGKTLGMGDPGYTIEAEIRPGHFHEKGALCAARQGDAVNPEKRSSGEQFYIVQGKVYTDEELNRMEESKLINAKNKLAMELFRPKQEEVRQYMLKKQQAKADSLLHSLQMEVEAHFKDYTAHLIPAEKREVYKTMGGTPFLDGEYTVFGEVVEGLDVVDKIAAQKTGENDRPQEDIIILKTRFSKK